MHLVYLIKLVIILFHNYIIYTIYTIILIQRNNTSLNKLAREYEVSKKLIHLKVNELSAEKNSNHIKEHWQEYYDREKHNKAVMKLRNNKKETVVDVELFEKTV